ncbi:MAG: UMP kinase [Christensenellaceae bacterium]|jgi:uridylate kinase|nr:UMP kinase [Christensenellaceae bacterium]
MDGAAYKRVLIKLSGEALGVDGKDFSQSAFEETAKSLLRIAQMGVEIALVIGAGNIWRGRRGPEMDRPTADYMGMLATVINALYMKDVLCRLGRGALPAGANLDARVQSAFPIGPVCEPYSRDEALRHLEQGRIVLFAAGTGHPFFSTDTTAALRAAEIGADALLMAKNVDFIYSEDPKKNPNAQRFEDLSFDEALRLNLKVMDASAFALCQESALPILCFGLNDPENLIRAARGEKIGTLVHA